MLKRDLNSASNNEEATKKPREENLNDEPKSSATSDISKNSEEVFYEAN